MGLGWVGKFYKKTIYTSFNWSSLAKREQQFSTITWFQLYNKHTLSNLILDFKFDHGLPTLHIEVLIHLDPKSLEPNNFYQLILFLPYEQREEAVQ